MGTLFSKRDILRFSAMGGTILTLSQGSHAQGHSGVCAFTRRGPGGGINNPTNGALSMMQQVMSSLGVGGLAIYSSYQVENAAAYPSDGVVLYNPDFMNRMQRLHGAAPISVLAHEVGHFSQAGGYAPNSWTRELSADYISGVSMRRLGYDNGSASVALRSMFDAFGSSSHPDTPRRINAMMSGYSNGR